MKQQQLREGVVLEDDALGQPALAMPRSWGKSQGLSLPSSSRKYFSKYQLGQQKRDLLRPAAFQVVQRVDAGFADNRGILGLGRNVGRGEG